MSQKVPGTDSLDLKVQTVVDLSESTHDEKRTKKEGTGFLSTRLIAEACTSDPASAPQLIDTTLRKVVFKQDASSKPGPSRKSMWENVPITIG